MARFISFVFHPLLLATYMFTLFALVLPWAFSPLKEDGHFKFVMLIFCVTFVLPSLNIGLFKAFGSIKSMAMEDRRDRVIPFIFVTILYSAITYLFYSRTRIGIHDSLLKFLIIIDVLMLVGTLVTLFYKVSIHTLGMWGLVGILLPLNKVAEDGSLFYPTIACIALAGVVMSARLQLNAHTPREVMVGSILGLATGCLSVFFLF
ncbi:hypothetical protein [Chryseolinea lacunae]|uniref:PAP2 family protein n=1 Tax=Chryseolinea lacunae TaxID=2801331 RepID=A0ABS1L375_9BACT|nr:hypothetical protein [Chryseolinea lacunae]MBL0745387.1 hypothetical protein [Chryseolinea lacunae]